MNNGEVEITTNKQFIKRDFQNIISQFLLEQGGGRKVLVVDAPTGSGKTHAFSNLEKFEGITFLVLPNNFLIEEKFNEFVNRGSIAPNQIRKLSRSEIDYNIIKNGLGDKNDPRSVLTAIEFILSGSKIVITNPSIIFLILYNHYWKKYHTKGSHLVELIEAGMVNVVFDEIHIYNKDQRNRILSINALLSGNTKFVYTSATIPYDLLPTLKAIFGNDSIEYIKVTTTIESESSTLLRGPINIRIIKHSPLDLPEDLLKRLKEDKWIIILNKIITINQFYKILMKNGFDKNEILLVSGYHDRNRQSVGIFKDGKARIIIASNIIEQGINPPKDYLNFIIEPGIYYYNFIQRIGRVGRGIQEQSYVVIPISNMVLPNEISKVNEFNDFVEKMSSIFKKEDISIIEPKLLGYYIGNFISRFSNDERNKLKEIIGKLAGGSEIIRGVENFDTLNTIILEDKLSSCFTIQPYLIEKIGKWWKSYNSTFQNFIKNESIVEIIDESITDKSDLPLASDYNELWVMMYKEILSYQNGVYTLGEDRSEPFKEFEISLINVPFEEYGPKKFGDIQWKEREIIIGNLENYKSELINCQTGKLFYQLLKDYLYSTAWPDRLIYKIEDQS
jgi:CRISPR-associated helicase Cas3